jgi:hypothetical protein
MSALNERFGRVRLLTPDRDPVNPFSFLILGRWSSALALNQVRSDAVDALPALAA